MATAATALAPNYGPPPPAQTAPYPQHLGTADAYAPANAPPPAPYAPQNFGYGPGVPPPPPVMMGYPMPQQVGYYPPQVGDRSNSLAVASFVCGLLGLVPFWVGFVLCIAAIIMGAFGLQQANRLPDRRGKGLAIAGLVLGIVFIVPAGCGL
jgi:hypothetical protein